MLDSNSFCDLAALRSARREHVEVVPKVWLIRPVAYTPPRRRGTSRRTRTAPRTQLGEITSPLFNNDSRYPFIAVARAPSLLAEGRLLPCPAEKSAEQL
jgi:hypothetical protein